jgi:hypothetical protein
MNSTASTNASHMPRVYIAGRSSPPGHGSGTWTTASTLAAATASSDRTRVLVRESTLAETVTGARMSSENGLARPPVTPRSSASCTRS